MSKSNIITAVIVLVTAVAAFALYQLNKMILEPKPVMVEYVTHEDDIIIGNPNAPIKVVEFISLGCSHCQEYHFKHYPKLKQFYIDTGEVALVLRQLPLDEVSMAAGAILECHSGDKELLIDTVFKSRDDIISVDPENKYNEMWEALERRNITFTEEDKHCATAEGMEEKFIARTTEFLDTYRIQATPSFIVGEFTLTGSQDITGYIDMINGNPESENKDEGETVSVKTDIELNSETE